MGKEGTCGRTESRLPAAAGSLPAPTVTCRIAIEGNATPAAAAEPSGPAAGNWAITAFSLNCTTPNTGGGNEGSDIGSDGVGGGGGGGSGDAQRAAADPVPVQLGSRLLALLAAHNGSEGAPGEAAAARVSLSGVTATPRFSDGGGGGTVDDWGVTLRDVAHLRLEHSVVRGLPLSAHGPLVACLNCSHLSTDNVTLQALYGSGPVSGAVTAPPPRAAYGALYGSGLLAADLASLRCAGVRDAHGWACVGLELAPTAAVPLPPPNETATSSGAGGAASSTAASVRLVNSSFISNSVTWHLDGLAGPGHGAVLVLRSREAAAEATDAAAAVRVAVSDAVFMDNIGGCGGALAIAGWALVDLHLDGSELSGNTAVDVRAASSSGAAMGGAVWVEGSVASLTVSSSRLDNNTAWEGGAIRLGGWADSIRVTAGSSVSRNRAAAALGGGSGGGGGGAISIGGGLGSLVVELGSSVSYNTAAEHGGAVYCAGAASGGSGYGDDRSTTVVAILTGSRVDHNSAGLSGGALALRQSAVDANISVSSNSSLSDNTANGPSAAAGSGGGGGVYLSARLAAFTVSDGSNVSSNTASSNASGASGGALYVGGGLAGAIAVQGGSRMSHNVAGGRGGAVCADGGEGLDGAASVVVGEGSELSGNVAVALSGGAVHLGRGLALMAVRNGSRVEDNSAAGERGGAVYVVRSMGRLEVSHGSSLSRNAAKLAGGGVYVERDVGVVDVRDGSGIDGNTIWQGSGAGLAVLGSLGELAVTANSSLSGNAANNSVRFLEAKGGGVWVRGNLSRVLVSGRSAISDNAAKQGGAALLVFGNAGSIRVEGESCVCGNLAGMVDGDGSAAGAIHVVGRLEELVVTGGSQLSYNIVSYGDGFGGAVRVDGGVGEVVVCDRSALSHNMGGLGGVLHVPDPPGRDALAIRSFTLCGASNMSGNVARTLGGAFYVQGRVGALRIEGGSRVSDNVGRNLAGGLYLSKPVRQLVITDSTVSNNSAFFDHAGFLYQAVQNGGPADVQRNLAEGPFSVTIARSTIASNYAWKNGGALYFWFNAALPTVTADGANGNNGSPNGIAAAAAAELLRAQLQANATLDIRISDSTFYNNSVGTGSGGALFVTNVLNYVVEAAPQGGSSAAGANSSSSSNTTQIRLAAVNLAVNVVLTNCTFSSNAAATFKDRFPYSDVSSTLRGHGGAVFVWSRPSSSLLGGATIVASSAAGARAAPPPASVGAGGGSSGNASSSPSSALTCPKHASPAAGPASPPPWDVYDPTPDGPFEAPWPPLSFPCRLAMVGVDVEGNTAAGGYGGGVAAVNCAARFTRCRFANNTSTLRGGGFAFMDYAVPTIVAPSPSIPGSSLLASSAAPPPPPPPQEGVYGGEPPCPSAADGGAQQGADPSAPWLLVEGSTVEGNAAADGGGFFLEVNRTSALVRTCTVSGNRATAVLRNRAGNAGGGVFAFAPSNMTVELVSCTLSGNAAVYGGAAYVDGEPLGAARLEGCSLHGNTAQQYGGGMFVVHGVYGVTVVANGSDWSGNSAGKAGGAISVWALLASGEAGSSQQQTDGGLVARRRGQRRLLQAAIGTAAAAVADDGAAVLSPWRQLTAVVAAAVAVAPPAAAGEDRNASAGTTAATWGIVLRFVRMYDNVAMYGGGLHLASRVSALVNASRFERNAAGVSGGAIAARLANLVRISGSSLYGNTAQLSGGGAFLEQCGAVLVEASDVGANTAPSGGAFHVAGGGGASSSGGAAAMAAAAAAVSPVVILSRVTLAGNAAVGTTSTGDGSSTNGGGNTSSTAAESSPEGGASTGGGGADSGTQSDEKALYRAYGGHGGGLFISGWVGVALADSRAAADNSAAVGSVLATTQTCLPGPAALEELSKQPLGSGMLIGDGMEEEVGEAGSSAAGAMEVAGLGPWRTAAEALQRAASLLCSLLLISNTRLAELPSGIVPPIATLAAASRSVFSLEVQLYDGLGQPVVVDIPAYRLSLSIRPLPSPTAAPGAFTGGGAAGVGPVYLRQARVGAPSLSLSATTSFGRASWAELDVVGWPGTYALDVTASVAEGLASIAPPGKTDTFTVRLELLPCSQGQELETTDDSAEDLAPAFSVCRDCRRDRVGLWADARPPLALLYDRYGSKYPDAMANITSSLLLSEADDSNDGGGGGGDCASCCRDCPVNAACPGGPLVIPGPGYWHSSAASLALHRCPQPAACGADSLLSETWESWNGQVAAALEGAEGSGRALGANLTSILPGQLTAVNFSTLLLLDGRSRLLGRCQQWHYSHRSAAEQLLRALEATDSSGGSSSSTSSGSSTAAGIVALAAEALLLGDASTSQGASPPPPCRLDGTAEDPSSYLSLQCAPGYTGHLCATCLPGHSLSSDLQCEACPSLGRTVGVGVLAFLGTVGLILVTTTGNMTKGRADAISASQKESSFVDLLKAVITHAQYYIIITRLGLDFPGTVTGYEKAMSAITGAENYVAYSPTCLFPGLGSAGQAAVHVGFGLATPCVAALVSMALWTARYVFLHQGRLNRAGGRNWRGLPSFKKFGSRSAASAYPEPEPLPLPASPVADTRSSHEGDDAGPPPVLSASRGVSGRSGRPPVCAAGVDEAAIVLELATPMPPPAVVKDGAGTPQEMAPYQAPGDRPAGADVSCCGCNCCPRSLQSIPWLRDRLSQLRSRLSPYHMLMFADQSLPLPQQLGVVLMVAAFILYPALCQVSLSLYACYRIDPGTGPFAENQVASWPRGYWVRDMQQECYAGRHASVYVPLGAACVLTFCLGPPVAFFWATWRVRHHLDETRTRIQYGFLFQEYKPRFYWYTSVKQLQCLALVTVEVFGRVLTVSQQALLLLAVLILIAAVNMACAPSDLAEVMLLEFLSCCVLSQTIILGLYSVDRDTNAVETALGALILALNVGFVLGSLLFALCTWGPAAQLAGRAAGGMSGLLHRMSDSVSRLLVAVGRPSSRRVSTADGGGAGGAGGGDGRV
ncbi:hypothetical protein GPECTOR_24g264 [Gonium pectorale]|uniref:Right handed beta helix domain-containing protein n=1 Tax=Gonium pectorale TaxID=33097 RepID=A0A150GGN3_GONPE|nr:hypothetical protein GPECTOR_24g264 [Gonium pectorale]|eukprot:KXZ48974.1 hypothetical protein GPECTOR_24g264 [Gonium pectorale]